MSSEAKNRDESRDEAPSPGSAPSCGALGKAARGRFPVVAVALLAGVVGVVLWTYWPALSAGALYMDDKLYLGAQALRQPSWGAVKRIFGEVLSPSLVNGYYQPVSLLSVMLDFLDPRAGTSLEPFHRTSLVLHLLNVALIVLLLHQLFQSFGAAALLGLLYGVHPLNADAVLWVAERKTLVSTALVLGSLLAYVAYVRQFAQTKRRDWKRYGAALLLYMMALLSKPTALPLVVLLLVLDYWPFGRLDRRALLEKVPFVLVAVLAAGVAVVSQARAGQGGAVQVMNLLHLPLVAGYCVGFYLFKVVWPAGLVSDYLAPQPFGLANPRVLVAVLATAVVAALVVLSARRTRAWLAGAAFFVVALVPTLGIVRYTDSIAANRSMYLPMVGLLLPLAWWLPRVWDRAVANWGRARGRLALGLLLGLTASVVAAAPVMGSIATTRAYEAHWRDSLALLQYYLTQSPDDWKLHTRLGNEWIQRGDHQQAIVSFRAASRLNPKWPEGQLNLGRALFTVGSFAEAREAFAVAVRAAPRDWRARMLMGMTLSRQEDLEGALREFRAAATLAPAQPAPQMHIASTLAALERAKRECDGDENNTICLTKRNSDWQSPPL